VAIDHVGEALLGSEALPFEAGSPIVEEAPGGSYGVAETGFLRAIQQFIESTKRRTNFGYGPTHRVELLFNSSTRPTGVSAGSRGQESSTISAAPCMAAANK
jgi:hypothetical protein